MKPDKNIFLFGNSGSTILTVMMILLIVTIIGMSTINNSTTEIMIANNDVLHKKAFYPADGGTQIAIQLIEESLRCGGELYSGTYETTPYTTTATEPNFLLLQPGTTSGKPNTTTNESEAILAVLDTDFAMDGSNLAVTNTDGPSDSKRDITFVETAGLSDEDGVPHTNIAVIEKPLKGRAGFSILMAEGYSGLGKGSGGNVIKPYDIHSRNEYRARNSCSHIVIEYDTDGKCDGSCPCAYQ